MRWYKARPGKGAAQMHEPWRCGNNAESSRDMMRWKHRRRQKLCRAGHILDPALALEEGEAPMEGIEPFNDVEIDARPWRAYTPNAGGGDWHAYHETNMWDEMRAALTWKNRSAS
ncbi:hypothetical protein K438DRAFT_1834999 [Mycena galopus ATCC 62051]|nr:hypothetical protein K438DRAFT_1834999 [Mycena galopus ATCC 62051]